MAKVRKVGVISFGRFQALILGIVGVFAGITYSFGGLAIDAGVSLGWITSAKTPGLSYGTALAFGALIGMPVLFAGVGFAVGIIEAFLYNGFARVFGGVEIEFEGQED